MKKLTVVLIAAFLFSVSFSLRAHASEPSESDGFIFNEVSAAQYAFDGQLTDAVLMSDEEFAQVEGYGFTYGLGPNGIYVYYSTYAPPLASLATVAIPSVAAAYVAYRLFGKKKKRRKQCAVRPLYCSGADQDSSNVKRKSDF
ncbi:MAG: hypothetical protein ISN29_08820 [Gammaproteobacteria bacterium AqS3]|nr:hypothetical protein [Gammaproteobacteria bacterium AqS3]